MPIVEALLTKAEVAKLARLTPRTIDRMLAADPPLIPEPARIGVGNRRRVRFRASDIDAWLRAGCPDRVTFERQRAGVAP